MSSSLIQENTVKNRFEAIYKRPVVLSIRGLTKSFANNGEVEPVLKDISFDMHRRELVAVIGPSGCGKSTLARLLAGLDPVDSGEMYLDAHQISGPGPDRGMVFQGYSLFPWLSVLKNVMFGLDIRGQSAVTAERDAREWLSIVGLEEYAMHYPHQLSGGMKQRVAIARALAPRPRVLLMDEPFGALDARTRSRMQHYLLEIWKNIDVSIVFITHDLEEAVYLADRIVVLRSNPGEIQEIIENPIPRPRTREQFNTKDFLSAKGYLEDLIHENEDHEEVQIIKMTEDGDEVI